MSDQDFDTLRAALREEVAVALTPRAFAAGRPPHVYSISDATKRRLVAEREAREHTRYAAAPTLAR